MLNQLNPDRVGRLLLAEKQKREIAATLLADFYHISPDRLFYHYLQAKIPQVAQITSTTYHAFHGLDCCVRTTQWKVDLEFGIGGCPTAFSNDAINLVAGVAWKTTQATDLIGHLIENQVIQLIDADFLTFANDINQMPIAQKYTILNKLDFETQVDLSVADRYVLVLD